MTLAAPFPLPLGELLIIHPSVLRRIYRHCNEFVPRRQSLHCTTSLSSTVIYFFTQIICISIFSTRLGSSYGQGPWPYSFPVSITCNPMNCIPPGSSVHEILQARPLEWVAIPFSRRSSQPRDLTLVSCTAGIFFTV